MNYKDNNNDRRFKRYAIKSCRSFVSAYQDKTYKGIKRFLTYAEDLKANNLVVLETLLYKSPPILENKGVMIFGPYFI